MLTGFQKYLVDKGFSRTRSEFVGRTHSLVEDYENEYLSAYGPLHYNFKKENIYALWGISESGKPPVMDLGHTKIKVLYNRKNPELPVDGSNVVFNKVPTGKTHEDGYRILFSNWGPDKYDEIYEAMATEGKYIEVDCRDEKHIKIQIKIK